MVIIRKGGIMDISQQGNEGTEREFKDVLSTLMNSFSAGDGAGVTDNKDRNTKTFDNFRNSGNKKGTKVEEDYKRRRFKVADIQEKHHQIKRLLFLGWKSNKIAEELNISTNTVTGVKNSPIIKDQLALMQGAADSQSIDLSVRIKEMAPFAFANLVEIISEGTVRGEPVTVGLIAKESNNLLDRYMGKPTQTVNTRNLHAHFNADDITKLKERALETIGKSS
jgi:hypothetical protein